MILPEISYEDAAKILLERRACRNHLGPFVQGVFNVVSPGDNYKHNWHIDCIAEHLEAVFNREIKRLIINIPPRYLKSISTTVAFPAWGLGKNPTEKFLAASYSQFLAYKHSDDCRLVIQSDWYKALFPDTKLAYGKIEKRKFETTAKGHRMATSVGGASTGLGGNILIIDDPVDPEQAASELERKRANNWFDQTISTRLDDKINGAVVIVMQRLHQDDLAGHVQDNSKEDWTVLKIPGEYKKKTFFEYKQVSTIGEVRKKKKSLNKGDILHPQYEGRAQIETMKLRLGTYGYSCQYEQTPSPEGGGIIKLDWFRRYKTLPDMGEIVRVTQFWDTAQKADEVLNAPWVCGTWYSTYTHHYLVNIFRDWMDYPTGKAKVQNLNLKFKPNAIIIENKSTGQSLLQELPGLPVIGFEPEMDKVTRLSVESPAVEAGIIYLPETASWLFDFEQEIQLFPNSTYKDQADMLSMSLKYFRVSALTWAIGVGGSQSVLADYL